MYGVVRDQNSNLHSGIHWTFIGHSLRESAPLYAPTAVQCTVCCQKLVYTRPFSSSFLDILWRCLWLEGRSLWFRARRPGLSSNLSRSTVFTWLRYMFFPGASSSPKLKNWVSFFLRLGLFLSSQRRNPCQGLGTAWQFRHHGNAISPLT